MKGIFFWATVDIFWVMESWVMKKLLGPNGRMKTQLSQILPPGRLEPSQIMLKELRGIVGSSHPSSMIHFRAVWILSHLNNWTKKYYLGTIHSYLVGINY